MTLPRHTSTFGAVFLEKKCERILVVSIFLFCLVYRDGIAFH